MGDWVYYSTLMPLSEVSSRFRLAEEIHKSETLCDLIQRSISKRTGEISSYLLRQKQRLFNSVIAGVYQGDPQWFELSVSESNGHNQIVFSKDLDNRLGALYLTGDEQIFALDGQHRVGGIQEALKKSEKLGNEHLSVIFVAHRNDKDGLQRSRRLFATLNRYAKPVSKLEIIALDEDDPFAIVVRDFLRDHSLLSKKGVVATPKGKVMPASDTQAFTTAVVLYEALVAYWSELNRPSKAQLKEFQAERPDEAKLSELRSGLRKVIDLTIDGISDLKSYKKDLSDSGSAQNARGKFGGNLIFRPVGFLAYMIALGRAVSRGKSIETVVKRIGSSPLQLSESPWANLMFDAHTGTMSASSGRVAVESYAIILLLASGMAKIVTEAEKKAAKSFVSKEMARDGGRIPRALQSLFSE